MKVVQGSGVVVAMVVALCACGRSDQGSPDAVAGERASGASGGLAAGGNGGASGGTEMRGGEATGASGAGTNAGGLGGMSLGGGDAGEGGGGGTSAERDITAVKPTAGCGKAAEQVTGSFVRHSIMTSGVKAPDATGTPGPWSYEREYFVWLPPDYDDTKAYPLVIQAPGCAGTGVDVYSLSADGTPEGVGVEGSVIRIGLTPPPHSINHTEAPNQGCFDDKEGDDSVEWHFYEGVLDELKAQVCFDQNRVFASGNSSGARLADELGCKYAGNDHGYAVRGVLSNNGDLPYEVAKKPTCSPAPMAGLWVYERDDGVGGIPLSLGAKRAIKRAMLVNECADGMNLELATLEDFPIGAGNAPATCQRILGCRPEHPLVICELPGNGHGSHESVVNAGVSTFIRSLAAR